MYSRISLLIIPVLYSLIVASTQLTFSKDTVEFSDPYSPSGSMTIKNNTNGVISIDTIRYIWKIDGKIQTEAIGMELGGLMYIAPDAVKKPDTSFCFYQASYPKSPGKLTIQPHEIKTLSQFLFGHCVGCSAIPRNQSLQSKSGQVSIRTIFSNNLVGRDTVFFIGPTSALISSGTIEDISIVRKAPAKRLHNKDCYSLTGRKMEIPVKRNNGMVNTTNVYIWKSGSVSTTLQQ